MSTQQPQKVKLITIVAQHKDESKVLGAALGAGAPGVTYFYARGTGVRQRLGLLGRLIESEKVVLMLAVPQESAEAVVKAVTQAAGLDQPGRGFVCVQSAEQVAGFL